MCRIFHLALPEKAVSGTVSTKSEVGLSQDASNVGEKGL